MPNTNLGKVSVTPKGAYDPNVQYDRLDVIRHNDVSYIVLKPVRGVTPYEGEYYMEYARSVYYTPQVTAGGVLSWSNNGGLDNPTKMSIKGPKGEKGDPGVMFVPQVSAEGVLTWSNDGGLNNPAAVSIKGDKGNAGETGPQGPQGVQGPEGPRGINGVAVASDGQYAFNVDGNGHLILSYTGDETPNFVVNQDGHLILTI